MPLNIEEEEELIMYMLYIYQNQPKAGYHRWAYYQLTMNAWALIFLSLFFLFQTQNDYFSSYIFIGYGYG